MTQTEMVCDNDRRRSDDGIDETRRKWQQWREHAKKKLTVERGPYDRRSV
jgi:hypothetical protein